MPKWCIQLYCANLAHEMRQKNGRMFVTIYIWNSANFAFLPLFQIVCTNPLLPNYCFEEVHVTVIESVLNGSQLTSSTTEPASYADYPSPKTETAHSVDGSDSMHDPYNCNVTQDDLYMHKEGGDYGCSPGNKIPQPNTALFAIILTFGTFFISFFLRIFRSSRFLGRTVSIFFNHQYFKKFCYLKHFPVQESSVSNIVLEANEDFVLFT